MPDGVFVPQPDGQALLCPLPAPTVAEVEQLARQIARRLEQLYEEPLAKQQGLLRAEQGQEAMEAALEERRRPMLPALTAGLQSEPEDQGSPSSAGRAGA